MKHFEHIGIVVYGNLAFEVAERGPEVRAIARPLNEREKAQLGLRGISRFGEGITGEGKAKCRKEDRFDPDIGISLATARATADFMRKLEEQVESQVRTEKQARVDELEDVFADLKEALRRLAEVA